MAAISDVQVPAALAPVVGGVVSLHDFRPKAHTHKLGTFRRNKETGEVKPLFTFTGCGSSGAQPCYAVGPGDFAKIYNVPAPLGASEDSQSSRVAGVDRSAIYIIDNNSADILSESFGACEPNIAAPGEVFYNDLWQQAAAQGITVVLSSGDSSSDTCDQGANEATTGLSVSGLASTEFNVAVGGTDFLNGAI